MAVVPVHFLFDVAVADLDRAEAALGAFAAAEDDPTPLHDCLDLLFHRVQTELAQTVCHPDAGVWEVLAARLSIGERRVVNRGCFETLVKVLARRDRLIELGAPRALVDKDDAYLASLIPILDVRSKPDPRPYLRLDKLDSSNGAPVVDLPQFAAEVLRLAAGAFPRNTGCGRLDSVDPAWADELEGLGLLDDWWHIHRQRFMESEVCAIGIAPSILSDPGLALEQPLLSLDELPGRNCAAWRAVWPTLCAGDRGGPITRRDGVEAQGASGGSGARAHVAFVWVETDTVDDFFQR